MAQSIVYLHGVPESGQMWQPFVERTGGDAPDLPGFGRSDKRSDADYSFRALGRWVSERTAPLERFSLVMHDWGAVGLLAAIERPEAIERLVLIDAVPLLPGYRWHPIARLWRTPVVGEVAMGLSSKRAFKRIARRQAQPGVPDDVIDEAVENIWRYFDHGTQRAILRLYRSADEHVLAEAGRGLARIEAPALVIHGAQDPYIPARFAQAYAEALGGAVQVEVVEGGGHWPWYEQPSVIDGVAAFLAG
jgi:pimeloyl-ACP methyl ester carboxylesterase